MSTRSSTSTRTPIVGGGNSCTGECCARERGRLTVAQKRLDLQKERLGLDQELLEAEMKNFRKTVKLASKNKSIGIGIGIGIGGTNNHGTTVAASSSSAASAERDRTRHHTLALEREVAALRSQLPSHRATEERRKRREQEQVERIAAAEFAAAEISKELNLTILTLEQDLREAKRELDGSREAHANEKERWERGTHDSQSITINTVDCSSSDEEIQRLRKNLEDNALFEKNAEEFEALREEWRREKETLESRLGDQSQQIDNWKLLLPRNQVLLEQTQSKNKQLANELEELRSRNNEQANSIMELERQWTEHQQEQEDNSIQESLPEEMDTISLEHDPNDTGNSSSAPNNFTTLPSDGPVTTLIPLDFTSDEMTKLETKFVVEWEWTNNQNGLGGLYTGWLDVEGNPSGKGTLRIDDGGIYTGEWKQGLRTGIGVYTSIDGALYSGPWLNNNFQGRGVYVSDTNQVYTGDWTDGLRHGTGIETWEHGARYAGHYYRDKRNGRGSYTYPDGRRFEGIYKDDQPDGNGRLTSSDNSVLHDGEWSLGEFVGS